MIALAPMISNDLQQDLLAYLQQAFELNFEHWQPLLLNQRPLGLLNPRWQAKLQADLSDFVVQTEHGLNFQCRDWLHCADVLQNTGRDWYDLGLFTGWRNEFFDVTDGDEVLFALERALFRPLGLLSQAVHINGFVERDGEQFMWIGTRSPYKAVDPDKLDNLVGGGVGSGESLSMACMREGFEEAGLAETYLTHLHAPRRILSQRLVERGLHREHLFVYDLDLPDGVQPINQDGEVANFQLMTVTDIVTAILNGQFMHDAALVTLDGLLHKGWIEKDSVLGSWLQQQYV